LIYWWFVDTSKYQLQRLSSQIRMKYFQLRIFWYESEYVESFESKFYAEQIEYLGYWITWQYIQPIRNKLDINDILNIEAPKTRKDEPFTQVYWFSQLLSRHVVSKRWASSQDQLNSLTSSKINFEWHYRNIFRNKFVQKWDHQNPKNYVSGRVNSLIMWF
jgi:hypothetical protein